MVAKKFHTIDFETGDVTSHPNPYATVGNSEPIYIHGVPHLYHISGGTLMTVNLQTFEGKDFQIGTSQTSVHQDGGNFGPAVFGLGVVRESPKYF